MKNTERRKDNRTTPDAGRCCCGGLVGLGSESADALIKDWRKQASGCMGMARHHEKERWKAHHSRKDAESREHENDRYRWRRVAETFRHCATELRRQMVAANKRQPQPNDQAEARAAQNTNHDKSN